MHSGNIAVMCTYCTSDITTSTPQDGQTILTPTHTETKHTSSLLTSRLSDSTVSLTTLSFSRSQVLSITKHSAKSSGQLYTARAQCKEGCIQAPHSQQHCRLITPKAHRCMCVCVHRFFQNLVNHGIHVQ